MKKEETMNLHTAQMIYLPHDPGTWIVTVEGQEIGTVTMTGHGYVSDCRFCDRLPIAKTTAHLAGQYLAEHSEHK